MMSLNLITKSNWKKIFSKSFVIVFFCIFSAVVILSVDATPTPTPTPTPIPIDYLTYSDIDAPSELGEPYPDVCVYPFYFDGYWYDYVRGMDGDKSGTAVHLLPSGKTYATAYTSDITNNVATDGSNDPYIVIKAPVDAGHADLATLTPTPVPSQLWFSRMARIFGVINEDDNTAHAIFHAEDTYGDDGLYNENMPGGHRNYARIGLVSSSDPLDYDEDDAILLLECFMNEDSWREHHPTDGSYSVNNDQVGGIRHPWPIEVTIDSTDYIYIFYDRTVSSLFRDSILDNPSVSQTEKNNLIAAFSEYTDTSNYGPAEICVARAVKDDFLDFANGISSTNPFYKFYDDDFDSPPINEMSGTIVTATAYSTPIIDPGSSSLYRETPSVCYNQYLESYTMLVFGQDASVGHSIKMHLNSNDDLTEWDGGLRIDLEAEISGLDIATYGRQGKYPSFIHHSSGYGVPSCDAGNATNVGDRVFLYFSDFNGTPGDTLDGTTRTLWRILMDFDY
jgi:hypothetical protein